MKVANFRVEYFGDEESVEFQLAYENVYHSHELLQEIFDCERIISDCNQIINVSADRVKCITFLYTWSD